MRRFCQIKVLIKRKERRSNREIFRRKGGKQVSGNSPQKPIRELLIAQKIKN